MAQVHEGLNPFFIRDGVKPLKNMANEGQYYGLNPFFIRDGVKPTAGQKIVWGDIVLIPSSSGTALSLMLADGIADMLES